MSQHTDTAPTTRPATTRRPQHQLPHLVGMRFARPDRDQIFWAFMALWSDLAFEVELPNNQKVVVKIDPMDLFGRLTDGTVRDLMVESDELALGLAEMTLRALATRANKAINDDDVTPNKAWAAFNKFRRDVIKSAYPPPQAQAPKPLKAKVVTPPVPEAPTDEPTPDLAHKTDNIELEADEAQAS